jgi:hypothetical protein
MVSTAYVILVRTACRRREYAFADPYVRAGVDYCSVRDHDVWRYYLLSWESKTLLARGLWSAATDVAQLCLTKGSPFARIHALQALGLVRARRGDPGAWEPLDEALELAKPREELQWIAPVAAARAEAAWLEGRNNDAVAETDVAWELAKGTWWAASLAYWRWRAGVDEPVPDLGEEQYRLEMDGRWQDASESWRVGGCRYSASFATLTGDDEEALRHALDEFRVLGAAPAAKLATARLREIGARGVPRGPRPSTRKPGEPDAPRARGPRSPRGGTAQRGDRRAAVHHGENRRSPRRRDPAQARRDEPCAGRHRGDPPRRRREAVSAR